MFKHTFHAAIIWILIFFSLLVFSILLLIPLKFAFASELTLEEQQLWYACQSNDMVRFHIIANSNSTADQAVKFQVRDAIVEYLHNCHFELYNDSSANILDCLNGHLSEIESLATTKASSSGYKGAIQVELGELYLPSKKHENVTLPAGVYNALRIIIGEGNGENWWCVLFPELCTDLSLNNPKQNSFLTHSSVRIFQNWLLSLK